MEDIRVRKLFNLLSVCVSNDLPLTQILLEKMSQSEEYQLLSSMDQFAFLTDQGRNLEKRMRDFKVSQSKKIAHTYNQLNNLKSLASEFKCVLKESRIGAEESINRPYREVHIVEKNYLQIRLDHDNSALNKSEVYHLWQERNNYVYENDAARQLKVDMDSFQSSTKTQAEIRQSYAAMKSFQDRFQQNRSGIISHQEFEQRVKAYTQGEINKPTKEESGPKFTNKLWVVAAVIAFVVFLYSTNNNSASNSNQQTASIANSSVAAGNIPHYPKGYVLAVQDDWIYYSGGSDNKLYKIRTDGTGLMKLSEDEVSGDNEWVGGTDIEGDWIYYITYKDGDLYKIRTDGTERMQLSEHNHDEITGFKVEGDWIYYEYSGWLENTLCKMRTDGTGRTILTDAYPRDCLNIAGDWIFYEGDNPQALYKIRTDGTGRTKLVDDNLFRGVLGRIKVEGDWLYYINYKISHENICKIRTNGTGYTELTNSDNIRSMDVVGEWIYYRTFANNDSSYKIRTDGSGLMKLKVSVDRHVLGGGDWLYYTNLSDGEIYRSLTDSM